MQIDCSPWGDTSKGIESKDEEGWIPLKSWAFGNHPVWRSPSVDGKGGLRIGRSGRDDKSTEARKILDAIAPYDCFFLSRQNM
jgi:hypothetical protein